MDRTRPIVVPARGGQAPAGPPTAGMDRRELFAAEDCWVGWVRTDAGLAGGWHHHGERDSYVLVLSGSVTIEFGPDGREQVRAEAGDVIFNPARMIHREVTTADAPAEFFVVRVGSGPPNVNVDGPEPMSGGADQHAPRAPRA